MDNLNSLWQERNKIEGKQPQMFHNGKNFFYSQIDWKELLILGLFLVIPLVLYIIIK